MTTTLSTSARPATAADLTVRREDIEFADVAPGLVRVAIRVTNEGNRRSDATIARIEAAPLGAFVPTRPLTSLPVPSLAPGESTVLETEVARPKTAPLGPPDRLPPRRILTALDSRDDDRPAAGGLASALLRSLRPSPGRPDKEPSTTLPPDLFELMGRRNPYWAGNLNIFIGRSAVERHMARALRIYPGRTNLAAFMVGTRPDAYSFDLGGADWETALYRMDLARSFADRGGGDRVEPRSWIEVGGPTTLMLAVLPPIDAESGAVEVRVRQRSTGQEAIVEFDLDPDAAGPGCYVVP